MSEQTPKMHDTPEGHVVVGLRIENVLLPEWFDTVREISQPFVHRMAVIQKPDQLVVQCEVPVEKVEAYKEALAEAWRAREQN
jgi:hypothetical protein